MNKLDSFLNTITMYKLVLYSLIVLIGYGSLLGFAGIIPYSGYSILISALLLKTICWLTNYLFSKSFNVPANVESTHITALILVLIITPIQTIEELPFLLWVAVLSISSKYILAYKNKHIFNPIAIALVITTFSISQSASWWVGTLWMLPLVILCGVLITKKLRRWDLVLTFLAVALVSTSVFGIFRGGNLLEILEKNIFSSPLFFFAFIMLTEPLTTPPIRKLRMLYAALIGLLIPPSVHIGSIYSTPDLALVIGNIFSYIVSPKQKLLLVLKDKSKIAHNTYDFVFGVKSALHFKAGQYLEWTINEDHPDSRGNRRYFSLASSPTEDHVRIGVKFSEQSSSFKNSLLRLENGESVLASQLAGDFTLPTDKKKKLVFIAGGIGITPFRSMIQYLLDKNEKREIILFYANSTAGDISYKELLDEASKKLGLKVIYILTNKQKISNDWKGYVGHITEEIIKKEIPDYKERTYYLSGPNAMVSSYRNLLKKLKIARGSIISDYFPGF